MSTLGNVNGKGSLPTVALRLGMYTITCERYLIHARSIHAAHTLSLLTYLPADEEMPLLQCYNYIVTAFQSFLLCLCREAVHLQCFLPTGYVRGGAMCTQT